MNKIDTTTLGPISTMRARDRDADLIAIMAGAMFRKYWSQRGNGGLEEPAMTTKAEERYWGSFATAALAAYRNATGDDLK